jgi:hypothetical protein
MFGFGKKHDSEDEYTRGYRASREFGELVDDSVTDEQLCQQWDIVEANHSPEYVDGYTQYVEDEMNRPWWKLW